MSSEGNDTDSIPDAETCDATSKQFAAITDTDEACAHFFLQDHKWQLEAALDAFYKASENSDSPKNSDPGEAEVIEDSGDEAVSAQTEDAGNLESKENPESILSEGIKVISYNIDGLDAKNFNSRMKAVCTIIYTEKPHIVFLQEVIIEGYSIIEHCLGDEYLLISGQNPNTLVPYFTAILLKRKVISCRKQTVKPFPTTMMGRTLLMVEAAVGEKEFLLMTAHLESTKESERERKKQLKVAFQTCMDASKDKTVIFGGDLNIRDKEIDEIGGVPECMVDAWKHCGARKFTEFTWDMVKNDNLQWEKKFKPRCRFDRIYVNKGLMH